MKHLRSYLILLAFMFPSWVSAKQVAFMMMVSQETDQNIPLHAAAARFLENDLYKGFNKEFPCIALNDMESVKTMLGFKRQQAIAGTPGSDNLSEITGAMGVEYLIILNVSSLNNYFRCSASCFYLRNETLIAAASKTSNANDWSGCCRQTADELLKELAKAEICPYKGTVQVEISTERKDIQKEEYPVYCNQLDGKYTRETTIGKYSNSNFELEKKGKAYAPGAVTYSLSEETRVDEYNFCHACFDKFSGKKTEGNRMYNESTTGHLDVQGLSRESTFEGERIDDSRVEITFQDDSTYTLRIKAASEKSDLTLTKKISATGICDNIPSRTEKSVKKGDVGINEVFGPFPGCGLDKSLTQSLTIDKTDPATQEKSTIHLEFTLTRE